MGRVVGEHGCVATSYNRRNETGGPMMRGLTRLTAAVGAMVVLVSGCGGGQAAQALTRKQVRTALPDGEAMPGWQTTLEPTALAMRGDVEETPCRAGRKGCAGSRFYGASEFTRDKGITTNFTVIAYKDEQAAEGAYGVMWKAYRRSVVPEGSMPKPGVGEQSSARIGTAGVEGEKRVVVQMRVGANLGWVQSWGGGITRDLAKLWSIELAERMDLAHGKEKAFGTEG